MTKGINISIMGIILFFILGLFFFSFAQQQETLTITTYYPSPYGSYNELTTYGNTYLAITPGNNVGIGTTNPGAKLDVNYISSSSSPILRLYESSGVIASLQRSVMSIYQSFQVTGKPVLEILGSGVIRLSDLNGTPTSIISSGNVGIGTTGPGYRLEVLGTSTTGEDLVIRGSGTDIGLGINNTGTNGQRWIITSTSGASGAGQGKLATYNWTTGRYGWVLDNQGNVGIGTASPVGLLQAGTSPSPGLLVTSSGNVGIGTTNPGAKLEVAGQVKITGGSPGAGKVLTSDANGLASWQSSSPTIVVGTASDNQIISAPSGYLRSECIAIASCMTNFHGGSPAVFAGQRAELVGRDVTSWTMGCGYWDGGTFSGVGICGYVILCQK